MKLIRDALGSPIPQYFNHDLQMFAATTTSGTVITDLAFFADKRLIRDALGSPIPQIWDDINNKFVALTEKNSGGGTGADGKSAYEIAVENGFVGTESEWLTSLKGKDATNDGSDIQVDGITIVKDANGVISAVGVSNDLTNKWAIEAISTEFINGAAINFTKPYKYLHSVVVTATDKAVNDVIYYDIVKDTNSEFIGVTVYADGVTASGTVNVQAVVSNTETIDSEEQIVVEWSDVQNKPAEYIPSAHTHTIADVAELQSAIDGKVEKVAGKQLSTNDYTTAEKNKLATLNNYTVDGTTITADVNGVITAIGGGGGVSSWNDLTDKPTTFTPSAHTHVITDVTNLQTTLDSKVDKVVGKSLSTNDYTTTEKNKLAELSNYTLPAATEIVLGGVKIDNLTILKNANDQLAVGVTGAPIDNKTIKLNGISQLSVDGDNINIKNFTHVTKKTSQSIANNTLTKLIFENIVSNPNALYENTIGLFTIKVAGNYRVEANAALGSTSATQGAKKICVFVNNICVSVYEKTTSPSTIQNLLTVITLPLVVGDKIEIKVVQNTGASLNAGTYVDGFGITNTTYASLIKVG